MIKRPTWILLIVLILAAGTYLLLKVHPLKSAQPTPTLAGNAFLITQADGLLQSLRISDGKGNIFQMQKDLSKSWVITSPTTGKADQGLAGAAESQVGALSIVTSLSSPDLAATGLDVPAYTMNVTFVSGMSHKIEVGNLTPTSSGYYIRFDGTKIYIVGQSGIDALSNLLKAPPFPATPTPDITPEVTVTPSSETVSPTP